MKCKILNHPRPTKSASEMKIGEVGIVVGPNYASYKGTILLRTFDALVDLKNPRKTWRVQGRVAPSFEMEMLAPGTEITLTVEEGEE